MRILLLTHSFNSLCQRLFVELRSLGHDVSVEFDIADSVTEEAVDLFKPDVVIAPYMRRAIPESVWGRKICLVVHPGVRGDRGPSALDWAIMNGECDWGVTVLQAEAEMDAGPVWATAGFAMRDATKSSIYRNEVTEAAVACVLEAIEKIGRGASAATAAVAMRGIWHPYMRQEDRTIDWAADDTEVVLRKLRAADGQPGVLDSICDLPCYLYDAHPEPAQRGRPGELIARNPNAICRATRDGAVWIGHLRLKENGDQRSLKLPATMLLGDKIVGLPEAAGMREIWYEERGAVGYLHFPFYNGAMSTEQCRRLRDELLAATRRPTRVIALMGGPDFWSNGIHLHMIEAAESAADESVRNIEAMNDLARAIITADRQITVSALQGNAGAGGVFLALASDRVFARSGIVLNPHYKAMGNLYGSEYWTYVLPKRVGEERARELTELRLPIGSPDAAAMGLIDGRFGASPADFRKQLDEILARLAEEAVPILDEKRRVRAEDERVKPLDQYRSEEMSHMMLNFYGFDPSYHVARYNFVYRVPHSRTPPHLAVHRRLRAKKS